MSLKKQSEEIAEDTATQIIQEILLKNTHNMDRMGKFRDIINMHKGSENLLLQNILGELSPEERKTWEDQIEKVRNNPLFSKN